MKEAVSRLMKLFEGFQGASGTHGVPEKDTEGLKWSIKSTAKTVRQPVTPELWEQHVKGERPLGVIPIREDNSCSWGSIDFDEYDVDLLQMIRRVEEAKYPLVPCRSKSGGLHLFLFLKKPEPAAEVQRVLRDAAASLGMAECEIFPKQTKILIERNDLGSWMVMPYFGSTFGGKLKNQHGLKKTGAEMTMGEFVNFAEKMLTTTESLESICRARRGQGTATGKKKRGNGTAASKGDFSDGPPCLQHLTSLGVRSDGRKRTLFMMALYYKRAAPDEWKEKLERANQIYFDPLPRSEVDGVIKSVSKKDYEYTCKEEPMRSCCDSILCRARKFGIGRGGEYPVISSLSKLNSDPPVWFADVLGQRLELSTDELQNYQKFHRHCMNRVNKTYRPMKQDAWFALVQEAMDKVLEIDVPEDARPGARLREQLEEFLTDRAKGDRKEDLVQGRPFESVEDGCYYFTIKSFERFLRQQGIRDFDRGKLYDNIVRLGGGKHFFNIENHKGVRAWFVPSSAVQAAPVVPPPRVKREDGL
jgi:hypothetical protein